MVKVEDRLGLYENMRLVTREGYLAFLEAHDSVQIEDGIVNLVKKWKIEKFQPDNYTHEDWTVWSFPDRGNWATHIGNYRGNWSPYIPRNLIDRYAKPGALVCDPMMGSGTTLVECKLMGREGIGVDISPDSVMVAMNRLDFTYTHRPQEGSIWNYMTGSGGPELQRGPASRQPNIRLYQGDARNLNEIGDETVELIATHPPYCGIVPYSKAKIPGDLSSLKLEDFLREIGKVAEECFRILKPNRYSGILIGDTRKYLHYIPIQVLLTLRLTA